MVERKMASSSSETLHVGQLPWPGLRSMVTPRGAAGWKPRAQCGGPASPKDTIFSLCPHRAMVVPLGCLCGSRATPMTSP